MTPQYYGQARNTKLSPYTDKLQQWLKTESNRGRKERRSVKDLYHDLVKLGYLGSYDRVVAYAKHLRLQQQQLAGTIGRGAFIPLTFGPGEAFQFDWSEDWAETYLIGMQVSDAFAITAKQILMLARNTKKKWSEL